MSSLRIGACYVRKDHEKAQWKLVLSAHKVTSSWQEFFFSCLSA
jgi:hypothetical protein